MKLQPPEKPPLRTLGDEIDSQKSEPTNWFYKTIKRIDNLSTKYKITILSGFIFVLMFIMHGLIASILMTSFLLVFLFTMSMI